MVKFSMRQRVQALAGGALLLVANLASAQYAWIDEKGTRQFSDRAPPASIPLKNILRSPVPIVMPADTAEAPAAKAAPAVAKLPPSLADREADYRKRQLAKAEEDKKTQAQAALQARRKSACDNARVANGQLASGIRIRNADNSFMDDKQRGAEQSKVNGYLAECNK